MSAKLVEPRSTRSTRRGPLAILLAVILTFTAAFAAKTNSPVVAAETVLLSGESWLSGGGVDVYHNPCSNCQWQCVELVNRLYETQDWISPNSWFGNGNQKYSTAPVGLSKSAQGSITSVSPGDVLVWGGGPVYGGVTYGHAGVVNKITDNGNGTKTVESVNQNTLAVMLYHTWNTSTKNITGGLGSSFYLIGVVHAPGNPVSTSGGAAVGPMGLMYKSNAVPIVGDWDGSGTDNVGFVRGNKFNLRHDSGYVETFHFGDGVSVDIPIAGDWDGDGIDEVGVRRGMRFYLRGATQNGASVSFNFGNIGDIPIAGDWNNNGFDSVGVVRGNKFIRRITTDPNNSSAHTHVRYGNGIAKGDIPIVGDWDNDGFDELGVVRGNTFYLKGSDNIRYGSGIARGDIPLVGNWDGYLDDDPGVHRPNISWYRKYMNDNALKWGDTITASLP